MIRTILSGVVLASILLLTGCITAPDGENRWNYVCKDGYEFAVQYSRNASGVKFTDANQELKLDRKETSSGGRYTDGSFVFWNKGQMALIRIDGETLHDNCMGDYNTAGQ